jgi:hypothetical protein
MSQKTGRMFIERASFVEMMVLANSILRNLALSSHSYPELTLVIDRR